jgi:hypothetical protein
MSLPFLDCSLSIHYITRSIYLFASPPLEKGGKGGFKCLENPPMSPFAKGGSFILNLKIVIEKCKQYNAPLNNKMAKREDRG